MGNFPLWAQFLLSFFIFVLGIVAGYFAVYIREWYLRPKLEVLSDRPLFSKVMTAHVIVVRNNVITRILYKGPLKSWPI